MKSHGRRCHGSIIIFTEDGEITGYANEVIGKPVYFLYTPESLPSWPSSGAAQKGERSSLRTVLQPKLGHRYRAVSGALLRQGRPVHGSFPW